MLSVWFLTLALVLLPQAGSMPAFPEGIFSPEEKTKLEWGSKVENRIKVYEKASSRIHRTVQTAISKGEFQQVPEKLELWASLLEASLQDIRANLKTKKKPRPLIKYEIQVRKAIAATQDSKIGAPVEQLDLIDSSLARASAVHKKLVEILFPN
jgi:hypothetical protein